MRPTCFSGRLRKERRISGEALLHVQATHEDSGQEEQEGELTVTGAGDMASGLLHIESRELLKTAI